MAMAVVAGGDARQSQGYGLAVKGFLIILEVISKGDIVFLNESVIYSLWGSAKREIPKAESLLALPFVFPACLVPPGLLKEADVSLTRGKINRITRVLLITVGSESISRRSSE